MQRRIIFDANDLLKLITHYTDGTVPLDAELREFMIHPRLQRMIGMWVRSSQFEDNNLSVKAAAASQGALQPIHVRYEGNKTMKLVMPQERPEWRDAPEAPKRQ